MRGSSSGGVLMEFGASEIPPSSSASMNMTSDAKRDAHDALRSVDSASSLSSTVYEDESEAPSTTATSSSATATASSTTKSTAFESTFFRFADFGGYGDDSGDNNEVLPPRTVSPTNQSSHESETNGKTTATTSAPPPLPLGARGVSLGSASARVLRGGRRKNSIEMFLSQSPSQALGGGFLKMALDDDHPPVPPPHRLPPRRHDATASSGVVSINQPPRPTAAELDADRSLGKEPTSSMSMPTAATSSYGYLMSHSPPGVDTDDEWSSTSSQEMLASSSSAAAYYYAESQAALHQPPPPQPHQSPAYGYSTNNYRYANDAYGATSRQPVQQQQQHPSSWGASPSSSYGAQSPYAMQSLSGFSGQQYHHQPPQQQHQYHSSPSMPSPGYHGHGHRAPSQRGYGRSMYPSSSSNRMGMMESSPPPSPHTSMSYGVKQCKFFLQGHCRMGNKCKFAHHQPQASSYHQQQQPQQSYHVPHASPATSPHHQQQHQQPHDYDSAYATPSTHSSFMARGGGASRSMYRSEMHHSSQSSLTMAPHPSAHHALGGSSLGAAPVAPVDALLKMEDVQGRVFSMSKDQNGCRLLQEQLEYYDERKALCDLIYAEAMDHLAEMMVDPFGNYLFQKLLERARPLQRLEIVRRVSGHLVAAALNLHGTRSVQKVVEVCATSAQVVELASDGSELRRVNLPDLIVEALKDDAVRLCIDSNGNHVIQRALQFMKPEYNQFVFDAVCKECTTVGTHRHGCCVLQRCLDAADDQQKREVIAQVEKQAMKLMQDPYGNYVVQYVLDSCTAEEAYGVIVKPLGNVFELSVQKFSSNVIEKCLEKAPPSVLQQYVEEITHCPKMQKMLQDQFANYVVQRALTVSAEDQCLALVKAIRPHLPAMKNTSGGRRITARILKRFPHMDLNLDLGFEPAALGASYAMGGMSMQPYGSAPPQYDPYGMPFASASGTGSLGLGLHHMNGSSNGRM